MPARLITSASRTTSAFLEGVTAQVIQVTVQCCSNWVDGIGRLTGKDIVTASLTQLCVRSIGGTGVWWDYMARFYDECVVNEKYSQDCVDKILKSVKIDKAEL